MNPVLLALIDQGLQIVGARSFPKAAEVVVLKNETLHNLRFTIFCGGCTLEQFDSNGSSPKITGQNWVECLESWLKKLVDLPPFLK